MGRRSGHATARGLFADPLARLFLCFSVVFGASLLFTLPPMQMPDEMTHFFKADAIAEGSLVARRFDAENAGSDLPEPVSNFGWHYDFWDSSPPRPYGFHALTDGVTFPLTGKMVPTGYPNTAIYPPFFYLPEAACLVLARWSGLDALTGYYLARLANLLTASVLAALAIALMPRGRLFMAMLLGLPMALALSVSCSQDAIQTACAALAAAALARAEASNDRRAMVASGLLLGVVVAAKPAYVPLAFLPLFLRGGLSARLSATGLALAIVAICGLIFSRPAKVGFLISHHVDAHAQAMLVLHHPLRFAHALLLTLRVAGGLYARQFLGVLGRLNIGLPPGSYRVLALFLCLGAALSLRPGRRVRNWRSVCLREGGLLACLVATGVLVFVALYLIWTPVGAPGIDGIQGRYFLPVAIMGALLLPHAPREDGRRRGLDSAVLAVFLLFSGVVTQWAIIRHFWQV
ncbi:DUF2142 domain-containing protein [Acidomonas methanolica]|uniref:DUF2142 domain-containing protein n=1 Tax=Acidomonas methanolica TaxID=437 RepID=UPI00211A4E9C|nr:DUF2142 domain-containing protein [Acidomonas methanolica]MCQ9154783.1 DUF2142 domain-containing protein [Acidomonas methanolica]